MRIQLGAWHPIYNVNNLITFDNHSSTKLTNIIWLEEYSESTNFPFKFGRGKP